MMDSPETMIGGSAAMGAMFGLFIKEMFVFFRHIWDKRNGNCPPNNTNKNGNGEGYYQKKWLERQDAALDKLAESINQLSKVLTEIRLEQGQIIKAIDRLNS